jgi:hypothetical protein
MTLENPCLQCRMLWEEHVERKTLEFEKLPLIEVALKRVIEPRLPVDLPFVVRLAESLGGRFDQVLDLPGIEQPPGPPAQEPYQVHTAKGCRLLDSRSGVTVTLQRDLLVARWSRTDTKTEAGTDTRTGGYPRFPELQDALSAVECAIRGFGGFPEGSRTRVVNVAYANRVEAAGSHDCVEPSPWPVAPDWVPCALRNAGQFRELQTCHRADNGTDRRLLLQYREDGGRPWFLLLTVAGKAIGDKDDPQTAEEVVHDALIEWFPQLLSEDAKAEYGLNT